MRRRFQITLVRHRRQRRSRIDDVGATAGPPPSARQRPYEEQSRDLEGVAPFGDKWRDTTRSVDDGRDEHRGRQRSRERHERACAGRTDRDGEEPDCKCELEGAEMPLDVKILGTRVRQDADDRERKLAERDREEQEPEDLPGARPVNAGGSRHDAIRNLVRSQGPGRVVPPA